MKKKMFTSYQENGQVLISSVRYNANGTRIEAQNTMRFIYVLTFMCSKYSERIPKK